MLDEKEIEYVKQRLQDSALGTLSRIRVSELAEQARQALRYKKALEFYASPLQTLTIVQKGGVDGVPIAVVDNGEIARKALENKDGG